MSWQARLLNLWLARVERAYLAEVAKPADLRRRFERTARWCFPPRFGTTITQRSVGGIPARQIGAAHGPVQILHLHGGAFIFGSSRTHLGMMSQLCALTGLPAVLPDYRLAPEHPFPAAFDDALASYRALVEAGQRVVLGGDSAGGGLAFALLHQICAAGLPQPVLTYGLSPFVDLTASGASMLDNAGRDVLLPTNRVEEARDMYLAGADERNPLASPLFGAFTGAGPVALMVGQTEILRDDALRLAARLRLQGVEVALHTVPDLPHVWPYFIRILPEAKRDLTWLAGRIDAALNLRSSGTDES